MGTYSPKPGTVTESWAALESLAEALMKGATPPKAAAKWFAEAVTHSRSRDPLQLVRDLGLYVHGRRRVANVERLTELVNKLIQSGNSIMHACELAAARMGCSTKTAYRWYRAEVKK